MTSPIGSKRIFKNKGFSFIEVMVTVAVLSFGIILVYKAYFKSLSYLNHVRYRLHAMTLLDNKITAMQKLFEIKKEIPFGESEEKISIPISRREVDFKYKVFIKAIEDLENIYELQIVISWLEGTRSFKLSRSTYIANYRSLIKEK